MISKDILIKRVQDREEKLKAVANELKRHFVGLDEIIDKVIYNIKAWYIFPEIIMRPTIICLFGSTGVGKTDLVRRLVKLLDFSDRYCEVEVANKGNDSWSKTIASVLKRNTNIKSGEPSVILLDEIQGFRTLDEEGHDILDYEMKDIWTLLSDGKLPYEIEFDNLMSLFWKYNKKEVLKKREDDIPKKKVKRNRVIKTHVKDVLKGGSNLISFNTVEEVEIPVKESTKSTIESLMASVNEEEGDGEEEENDEFSGDNKFSYYTLNYFKNLLRLNEPIEEIALWSDEKRKEVILKKMMDKTIYEEEDYTKSLIFISGNIDEAYGFTKNAKEVDVDADILHERSKNISILNIKEALGTRFRPEQISRMGNIHIIYPSLSRKSFETIIERKTDSIIKKVKDQTGINLIVDKTVKELIYNNGVFPTQGTRPVFSTISEILESVIPNFILKTMIDGGETITLKYERDTIFSVSDIGKEYSTPYLGTLDILKTRHNKNTNRKSLASVHEAGHAIAHAILFKLVPNQIVSTPISEDMEGFVYSQDNCQSKDMTLKRICYLLAGQEAEKLVFGDNNQTSGCSDDLRKATMYASNIVRKWGMSSFASNIGPSDRCPDSNNEIGMTNGVIENIIRESLTNTRAILSDNKNLLIDIIDALMRSDRLEPEEFKSICASYGVYAELSKSSEEILYCNFSEKYEEFKKKNVK